jgi:hypothetical protein
LHKSFGGELVGLAIGEPHEEDVSAESHARNVEVRGVHVIFRG